MPTRIVTVDAGEWTVEPAKTDDNMLMQVTIAFENSDDTGANMACFVRVKNHLDTAAQLTLIEAMIQQLNEVKQGLTGEVTKGTRS